MQQEIETEGVIREIRIFGRRVKIRHFITERTAEMTFGTYGDFREWFKAESPGYKVGRRRVPAQSTDPDSSPGE